ncbi:MAG: hypothetical protein DI629_20695 [Mesorhizobium amorphae]|nr:MAG: hypothetical protein DI629_20695 [Mesorhizobium amorphae]
MPETCALCDGCPFETPADRTIPEFHEIHVTVGTGDVGRFVSVCEANAIKPVVIAFQSSLRAGEATHVMTSQRVRGDRRAAMTEARRILDVMREAGLPAARLKIETSLGPEPADVGYFESHLAFRIARGDEPRLRAAAAEIGGVRMSRNAFRREGETITMMVTLRDHGRDPAAFRSRLAEVRAGFSGRGFGAEREIVEWCWLDENPGMDDEWAFAAA